MKRALVLSGGGNKGAFEVGAVYHLITESNFSFDLFAGTSVGALNAGFLAQGINWDEQAAQVEMLKTKWLSIAGNKDIYNFKLANILGLLSGGALCRPVGLKKLIDSMIAPEYLEKGKPLLIPSVALEDGELFVADSRRHEDRHDMTQFLLASASMPVYFPPVEIRGKHWVDGGLRNITPLNAVLNEWPNEIVVVTTYPLTPDLEPVHPKFSRLHSLLGVIHRTIDILTSEIASGDLRAAKKIAGMNMGILKSGIRLISISPAEPFTDHCLSFSPTVLQDYFNLGVQAARNMRVYG